MTGCPAVRPTDRPAAAAQDRAGTADRSPAELGARVTAGRTRPRTSEKPRVSRSPVETRLRRIRPGLRAPHALPAPVHQDAAIRGLCEMGLGWLQAVPRKQHTPWWRAGPQFPQPSRGRGHGRPPAGRFARRIEP